MDQNHLISNTTAPFEAVVDVASGLTVMKARATTAFPHRGRLRRGLCGSTCHVYEHYLCPIRVATTARERESMEEDMLDFAF